MTVPVYPDLFDSTALEAQIRRIQSLAPTAQALWGKMVVAEMLAHVNVSYEMLYETKHPRPNAIMRIVLRLLVKNAVVGPKPYKKGTPTAPAFRIKETRDFQVERDRLVAYMRRVAAEGRSAFEGRESHSFGPLSAGEWNVLFAKHLDHHLRQFGV